jgi:regulator of sigma E protease
MAELSPTSYAPTPPAPTPPAQPAEEKADGNINPVTAALILAGIAAFSLWRPGMAKAAAAFVLILGLLVFVHEWGHYQFARWGGMKVNRFGIGFPPWIYTKRRNGIDYSIGALPIGGMVDIAGLGSEEEMVATTKGEVVANPTRGRNVDAPHGQKQFQDAHLGWRFWTLFAGPLMNFLLAMAVFIAAFSVIGIPSKATPTTIVDMIQPGMAAAQAGLQERDEVTAVNGQPVKTSEEVIKIVRANEGRPLQFSVKREGQTLTKTITPKMDETTNPQTMKVETVPLIGIMFQVRVDERERVGLIQATKLGALTAFDISGQIFGLIGRAATGGLTKEDKRNVGGPVKIAQAAGQTADRGVFQTLIFIGGLSVNLGLLNLLPFPALDGGRILFLGYELIARRPLDPRKEGVVHAVGMVMLLGFMLFITLRDVVGLR